MFMESIKTVQLEILKIFKEFQRVCDKYSLRYFAIGGTCIGAVRHHGFIPWDDDIDVGMPYEDFNKLRTLKCDFQNPFTLHDFCDHPQYPHMYLKLQNVETTFIERSVANFPECYMGFYVDIMPLYGFPDKTYKAFFLKMLYLLLIKLNYNQRVTIKQKESFKGKFSWVMNFPIKVLKPFDFYSKKIEWLLSKYPFGITRSIIFGFRQRKGHIVFCFTDFGDYIELPFEDTAIRVPIGYDNYLRQDFGDYMQLPPAEKRVSCHPTAIVDLHKSYKEYQKEGIAF